MVMDPLNRRRFLRQAAFGSGAITVLGPDRILNAQSSRNADANVEMVHGRILNVSGATPSTRIRPTVVLETVEGVRPLWLGGARIWKGGAALAAHLEAGDFVWARGFPMADRLLLVTDLWANIVNVSGRVDTVVSTTTFDMKWGPLGLDLTRTTTVTMDAYTLVNDGASRARLRSGVPVQVVGTARDESSIMATRIFV